MNFKENDVVSLGAAVEGNVIGETRTIEIAKGAKGTVVLCHGDPDNPEAYEVEFFISTLDVYVLAAVEKYKLQQG